MTDYDTAFEKFYAHYFEYAIKDGEIKEFIKGFLNRTEYPHTMIAKEFVEIAFLKAINRLAPEYLEYYNSLKILK
jgi:hypothetical protein